MMLRRIAIVGLVFLTVACGAKAEKALNTVIDIAQIAWDFYPVAEPYVKSMIAAEKTRTAPTPHPEHRITDYFEFASSPECRIVDDSILETTITIICSQDETTVRFDEWYYFLSPDEAATNIVNSGKYDVTNDVNWVDNVRPDDPLGRYLELIDHQYRWASFFWTVNGTQLSGWAFRADGDQEALRLWWQETGGHHY
jgi:hypothetical protein